MLPRAALRCRHAQETIVLLLHKALHATTNGGRGEKGLVVATPTLPQPWTVA